jgi:hypothetical protein
MLHELRSFPLLEGYRGSPACDVEALEDVILRISALADAHPNIAELDCNPIVVGTNGAVVVGAPVRVAPAAPRRLLGPALEVAVHVSPDVRPGGRLPGTGDFERRSAPPSRSHRAKL